LKRSPLNARRDIPHIAPITGARIETTVQMPRLARMNHRPHHGGAD